MSTADVQCKWARKSAWAVMVCMFLSLTMQGCKSRSASSERPSKDGMRGAVIPVDASKAVKKDVPIDIQAVGTVEASLTVTMKSQVSGELMQVLFREGDFVKKGEELFKIDSRTL